jgi:hypothetical protein
MGEIERAGDPGAMQAHPQGIQRLTAAPQHQLPKQFGADTVLGVIRGSQLLYGEFAALDYAARPQGIDEREFSG